MLRLKKLLLILFLNNENRLVFGSFNPLHIGHKVIASYMLEFSDLDKILFVVSPKNPFKKKESLLEENHRLMIIRREFEDVPNIGVSDIEFKLNQPSYTIDTLIALEENNSVDEYSIIMGSDNLINFKKWKNYKEILKNFSIYVYPRPNYSVDFKHHNIHIVKDVPLMQISASFIRNAIKQEKNVSFLVPEKAWSYIDEMNFYR